MQQTYWQAAMFFATGVSAGPGGSAHPLTAPYQAFKTANGYLNIGGANQANWENLCAVLQRPDLLTDPRFRDNPARTQRAAELAAELETIFITRPTAEWLLVLESTGMPVGPVNDMAAAYADPQVLARDMVVEIEHPVAGRIRNIGVPVKLSETPGQIRRPAPTLGQHTDEVLAELDFTAEAIANLRATRAVI